MKKIWVLLVGLLLVSAVAWADTSEQPFGSPGVDTANVCAVIVTGNNGYTVSVQRSCDGAAVMTLQKSRNLFLEELSFQLSTLYSAGLRVINCQLNNLTNGVEYLCVVAR